LAKRHRLLNSIAENAFTASDQEMIDVGPITEDEMVLAFLQAEIDASRYRDLYNACLAALGFERILIDKPDLNDPGANQARKLVLRGARGYGANTLLFTGFPMDVRWRRVVLEPRDFEVVRYAANVETWTHLSNGTLLVSDGARNFTTTGAVPGTEQITGIVNTIRNGTVFPELIAAETNDGSLILIEGHSRATAYVLTQFTEGVKAFVGSSLSVSSWYFYGSNPR
jgi:hypothetical protein